MALQCSTCICHSLPYSSIPEYRTLNYYFNFCCPRGRREKSFQMLCNRSFGYILLKDFLVRYSTVYMLNHTISSSSVPCSWLDNARKKKQTISIYSKHAGHEMGRCSEHAINSIINISHLVSASCIYLVYF